jgi:hypothetical protein
LGVGRGWCGLGVATTAQLRSGNQILTARVTELEDDLAARTSLRRTIRAENR